MIALATLLSLINGVAGTPYIPGGDSPAGTDCSGLASWVANAATDRPMFGGRFDTGNEEAALLQRGFQHGSAPNALVIGWNGGHTAVTLPDGTPVSSGEHGGVRIGGAGAYQRGFTHHMFLPMPEDGAAPPPMPESGPPPMLVGASAPAPPDAAAPPAGPLPQDPAPELSRPPAVPAPGSPPPAPPGQPAPLGPPGTPGPPA